MSKAPSGKGRTPRNTNDSGNRIRVRAKRLDEIDETKLTLAFWLLARRLVEDRTDPRLPTEREVRAAAKKTNPTDEEASA